MAKKYIYADSAYTLSNPPKGVTVLEFDTETNTIGIYNNKKAAAAIPVQPEADGDTSFTTPVIPKKISELQNDKQYISSAEIEGKYALKSDLQSFLSDITYNNEAKVLSFTFKLSDGTFSSQDISISDLVDTYAAGTNIKIEGNTISFDGVIPDTSEFITIKDIKDIYALKSQIPAVTDFITAKDLPEVPAQLTKLSELQNDKEFITLKDIPESVNAEFVKNALKSYIKNYTAFEVMPNKVNITSGTIDDVTGLTYSKSISACTIHKMTIRSANPVADNDVMIDWGDGVVEYLKDGKYSWDGKGYEVSHDYADNMTKDIERFIVKIYGKNYYTIRHEKYQATGNNLMSRVFDIDLPFADHIVNFASVCFGADRLLKVKIPHSTSYIIAAYNFSSTFSFCNNLISVLGFEDNLLSDNCVVANMFNNCPALQTTDFVIPRGVKTIKSIFYNCKSLSVDVAKLIPSNGFTSDKIEISIAFGNTTSLTGTAPGELLWNAIKGLNDKDASSAFRNSGVGATVPKAWGGSASDELINKTLEQRVAALEAAML